MKRRSAVEGFAYGFGPDAMRIAVSLLSIIYGVLAGHLLHIILRLPDDGGESLKPDSR